MHALHSMGMMLYALQSTASGVAHFFRAEMIVDGGLILIGCLSQTTFRKSWSRSTWMTRRR